MKADVEVDAFPGEKFMGRIAHVAPVLDPATRTAQIEVEIENPQVPAEAGMYAKVSFTVEHKENTLVVPTNALVDLERQEAACSCRGEQGDVAKFKPVDVGMIDSDAGGSRVAACRKATRIVTTGAAALREGDRIVLPGQAAGRAAAAGGGGRGRRRRRRSGRAARRPARRRRAAAGRRRPRRGRERSRSRLPDRATRA